jgi:hypothetical protein
LRSASGRGFTESGQALLETTGAIGVACQYIEMASNWQRLNAAPFHQPCTQLDQGFELWDCYLVGAPIISLQLDAVECPIGTAIAADRVRPGNHTPSLGRERRSMAAFKDQTPSTDGKMLTGVGKSTTEVRLLNAPGNGCSRLEFPVPFKRRAVGVLGIVNHDSRGSALRKMIHARRSRSPFGRGKDARFGRGARLTSTGRTKHSRRVIGNKLAASDRDKDLIVGIKFQGRR